MPFRPMLPPKRHSQRPSLKLNVRELKASLRAAGAHVLCLSNPNNPTGAVLPQETVVELAAGGVR
jgi:histidinol-phosphate/aromatic aminotransferase/cobyric acid decarboxylase-like protein